MRQQRNPQPADQATTGNPFHNLLANGFEEKPLLSSFYSPSAPHTNPWAIGTATVANAALLALLILLGLNTTLRHNPPIGDNIHLKDFTLFTPPSADHGGGSGGDHSLIDPIVGHPPKVDLHPITPPQVPILDNPRLAVDPSIAANIKLPDNSTLPNIGVQTSPNVALATNGPGNGGGIGTHCCGGDGTGSGPSYGPGDQVYKPGVGGVTNPIPIVQPDAEFSDEARRQKYQGVCMISIVVDAQGYPRNPHVVRSLGMGLDEKALEAVAKYRFKPALKNGKPVAAAIWVEVNFRLY